MARTPAANLHTERDERLWDEELARVRARRGTITPAAAAAVESALRSILGEQSQDDSLASSTLAALEEAAEPRLGCENLLPVHVTSHR